MQYNILSGIYLVSNNLIKTYTTTLKLLNINNQQCTNSISFPFQTSVHLTSFFTFTQGKNTLLEKWKRQIYICEHKNYLQ